VNDVAPPPAPDPPAGYPADLERTWLAADGTTVRIRPLRPDDLDRELSSSPGCPKRPSTCACSTSSREVSREDAQRLLDELDYHDRMAVGAHRREPPDETSSA
jgi:hypothetical protein